jgi:hypothetical protein
MSFEGYATEFDVWALGLSAQAFATPSLSIVAVDASTGTLTIPGHACALDALLHFDVLSSSVLGATAAALPGGLALATSYYARPVDGSWDLLRLSLSAGGATISSFTDAGVGVFGITVDPTAKILRHIRDRGEFITTKAIAYRGGFQKDADDRWPFGLTGLNARMAARTAMPAAGLQNPVYRQSFEAVLASAKEDESTIIDLSQGKLCFGPPADVTANVVQAGATSWSSASDGGGSADWLNVAGGGLLS